MTDTDWIVVEGDTGSHAMGAQWLLAGHNIFVKVWYRGEIDGTFNKESTEAASRCKFDLGYNLPSVRPTFGFQLKSYLIGTKKRSPLMLLRSKQRVAKLIWPTDPKGKVIGFPGVGTHSFTAPPNNWESDNAWDISVPLGSRVYAVAKGTIGPNFGPLPDPDPRFHGIRLHLVTDDNEFYYAHLLSTAKGIAPGAKVEKGDLLGKSGYANGVDHLHIGVKHLMDIGEL